MFFSIINFDSQGPLCIINLEFRIFLKTFLFRDLEKKSGSRTNYFLNYFFFKKIQKVSCHFK
jgi:hypothetical protein